jgi:glucuronoarabinoxylan endo-1,4-beta-xylanase
MRAFRVRVFVAIALASPLACGDPPSPVDVVVDPSRAYQEISGFGACFITWKTPPDYFDPSFYDRLVYDVGLSIIRCPIPGQLELHNDDADPNHFRWEGVDLTTLDTRMRMCQEFQRRGVKTFIASLWSPPPWMKTNRNLEHGGHLRPDMRDEYAEFLALFIAAARERYGIEIHALSLQNELLFIEPYDSCIYHPNQIREAIRAVMRRFARDKISTKILFPEDMNFADRLLWYIRPTMEDPETSKFPGFFCSHGGNGEMSNWKKIHDGIADYQRAYWMTEGGGKRTNWRAGMALATQMHNAFVGGHLGAWVFWQVNDIYDQGPTRTYDVARHFARFVRPGARRVESACADASLLVSAYHHVDAGTLTHVWINTGQKALVARLRVAGEGAPSVYRVSRSGEQETSVDLGRARAQDGAIELEVPARSILTLFGAEPGKKLPALPELPIPTDEDRQRLKALGAAELHGAGNEPLHIAARTGDLAKVQGLLKEGWDPDQPNVAGLRPLHRAARTGHANVVAALIAGGANPDGSGSGGDTPLHIGAVQGHVEFVAAMLKGGADPDVTNGEGWTPLHGAALRASPGAVRGLIQAGAGVNARTLDGWTPLHAAMSSHYAGSPEVVGMLLKAGADAHAKAADGWTPLHAGAANSLVAYRVDPALGESKVELLLRAGANVNASDASGRTPLHWAAWIGQFQDRSVSERVVVQLLKAGARPDARDKSGRTAQDLAAVEGYDAIVKALQAARADGDRLSRDLLSAARAGKSDQVRQLLQRGASVNASDAMNRKTALHFAVEAGHDQVAQTLIDAGADRSLRDSDGFTPLDRARDLGWDDIARALASDPQ